jgi:formylglycine-generating enzyme
MKRIAGLGLVLIVLLFAGCAPGSPPAAPLFIDTGVDSDAWVQISAGEFLMGQHDHVTPVEYDYEIMVTAVTNAQYASYLNEALVAGDVNMTNDAVKGNYAGDAFHAHEHEEEIVAGDWLHVPLNDAGLRIERTGDLFQSISGYENHPMVHVTWFGAKAYCEWHGWRLPDEVEWEKAARGDDGRPFPWGNAIQPGNANYYSSHDIFERIAGELGDTAPVGFYNGSEYDGYQTYDSPSPYGLYDMAGNVWQWTGDVYEGTHYRYMRGGSKVDYAYNLRVWMRNSARPDYHSPSVGFRCVRAVAD